MNLKEKKPIWVVLSKLWRWSWAVTLPITIVFLMWSFATYDRYSTFGVRYNSNPFSAKLLIIGKMEFDHFIEIVKAALGKPGLKNNSLKTIDLFLHEADERKLNSNLPHSGREYVEGRILHANGNLYKVKLKYRGDFAQHWAYYKKSLRVKTKKKRLYEDMRTFNLTVPKLYSQLNSYLAYKLAGMWGFISPRAEMINLRINGENMGIYLLVEQLKELTLRRNNRMPGDLYAGELIGRDSYRGLADNVFIYPGLWKKMAKNNHYPGESLKPLETMLQHLNSPQSEGSQAELLGMLDLSMWGRFSAFEILTQTVHYDNVHNWRLYYDPAKSVFEPIIWDPVGWHIDWRPAEGESAQLDIIPSQLHEILHQNYQFLLSRYQAIEDFFYSGLDKRFLKEVDLAVSEMVSAVENDPNIIVDFRVLSPAQVKKAVQKLKESVYSIFNDVEEEYLSSRGKVYYSVSEDNTLVRLSINGRQPVQKIELNYLWPLTNRLPVHVAYWVDGRRLEVDISGAVSVAGSKLTLTVPLLARHIPIRSGSFLLKSKKLDIKPAYYELSFKGMPEQNPLQSVYTYRGGNVPEEAKRLGYLEKIEFHNSYSIVMPHPLRVPEVWTGDITIKGIRNIKGDLVIKPGTNVKMAEGASLIIEGSLMVEGTHDHPVRFIPARADQAPWGVVVLKGKGADGSELRFCEFSGGSGLKSDLFEYSAMLSIHDVKGVTIDHCRFNDNRVVDDMVHTVYTDILFTDTVFERAHADALDLDISKAVIERCRFIDSRNDAIDLMTTEALIKDTLFQSSSDKGISVGEGSYLFALNSRFIENEIAVQSKDKSVAVLYNVDLEKNGKALDAYKKNWQYGTGGLIRLYKGRVVDNIDTFSTDKKSHIWVYDSYVKGGYTADKRIEIDMTVDNHTERAAKIKEPWRHPDDAQEPERFSNYWAMVNPFYRGAVHIDY